MIWPPMKKYGEIMEFTKMDESIALVYDGIGMRATMKLIYGKQAVIDDVEIHATPQHSLQIQKQSCHSLRV